MLALAGARHFVNVSRVRVNKELKVSAELEQRNESSGSRKEAMQHATERSGRESFREKMGKRNNAWS